MTEHVHECRLADAPIGLFWYRDTLALKTEYGNNEGRIDAYIVSSGEFFWGSQPQTIESQNNCMVRPVSDAEARLNATERLEETNKGLFNIIKAYHPEYLDGCECPQCGDMPIYFDDVDDANILDGKDD